MCVCVCARVCVCVCAQTYTHTYTHINNTHICVCACMRTHTHIHTRIYKLALYFISQFFCSHSSLSFFLSFFLIISDSDSQASFYHIISIPNVLHFPLRTHNLPVDPLIRASIPNSLNSTVFLPSYFIFHAPFSYFVFSSSLTSTIFF